MENVRRHRLLGSFLAHSQLHSYLYPTIKGTNYSQVARLQFVQLILCGVAIGADFGCNVVAYNCTAEHLWLQSILCVSGPEREMQWDSCALAKALWLGNCPETGKHANGGWPMATRTHPSLNDKTQGVFLQPIPSTDGNKSQSKYTPQQRTMLLASLRLNPSLEISDLIL